MPVVSSPPLPCCHPSQIELRNVLFLTAIPSHLCPDLWGFEVDLGVTIISFEVLASRASLLSAQCNDPFVDGVNELTGKLICDIPRKWTSPLLTVTAVPERAFFQDA
jgi:hypothetical protein